MVVSQSKIEELKELASPHEFKEGQFLFYEDHAPYGLFLLSEGEIEIYFKKSLQEKVMAPAMLG